VASDSDSSDNPLGEEGAPKEEEEKNGPAKRKVHRKRCFLFFQRKVKGKPKVEPKKVSLFMPQKMLNLKYKRNVTIKDKDGKDSNKLKVVKLIKNEGQ
jgi:hypothetical protein